MLRTVEEQLVTDANDSVKFAAVHAWRRGGGGVGTTSKAPRTRTMSVAALMSRSIIRGMTALGTVIKKKTGGMGNVQ